MTGRAVALALSVILSVGVAGCDRGAPTPSDIAENYVNALAQGDYATACGLLGHRLELALVRSYGAQASCRAILVHCLPNQATVLKRDQTQLLFATVESRIVGRKAFVAVSGTSVARRVKEVTLLNGANGWQLISYGRGLSHCRAPRRRQAHS